MTMTSGKPLHMFHTLRRQCSNRTSAVFTSRHPFSPSSSFSSSASSLFLHDQANSSDVLSNALLNGSITSSGPGSLSQSTSTEASTQPEANPSGSISPVAFGSDSQVPGGLHSSWNRAINSPGENRFEPSGSSKLLELSILPDLNPSDASISESQSTHRTLPYMPSALFGSPIPRHSIHHTSHLAPNPSERGLIGNTSCQRPTMPWASRAFSSPKRVPLESGGVSSVLLYRANSSLSWVASSPLSEAPQPHRSGSPYSTAATSTSDPDSLSTGKKGSTSGSAGKKKQRDSPEKEGTKDKTVNKPQKSALKPPKSPHTSWQIYFANYLNAHRENHPNVKFNVVHVTKEAATLYKGLGNEEMEALKRQSRLAKEVYKKEFLAWQKTLTPDDVRHENAFRTAQRRAGKSRRSNIKDLNAPKRPLSAYFMFLGHIRSDPALTQEVFGNETETTKQSTLAARKWKSLTDDERKVFLKQAEAEKLDYLAKLKEYEENYAMTRDDHVDPPL